MRQDINVVLGGVALVKGDIRESGHVMVEITKEINPYLVGDGFLADAPFKLLNGIIRFGMKFDPHAEIGPIDKQNNELPFAVEVEMDLLRHASKDEVKEGFLGVLIPALFAIAVKYELPTRGLRTFSELKGFSISQAN